MSNPRSDRTVPMGDGTTACLHTMDSGMLTFRTDATDAGAAYTKGVCLIDNAGRIQRIQVPETTFLIMVPIGELGAVVFDPMHKTVPGQEAPLQAMDELGNVCFSQRPALSRAEVFDLVHKIMAAERGLLHAPKASELRQFGIVKP